MRWVELPRVKPSFPKIRVEFVMNSSCTLRLPSSLARFQRTWSTWWSGLSKRSQGMPKKYLLLDIFPLSLRSLQHSREGGHTAEPQWPRSHPVSSLVTGIKPPQIHGMNYEWFLSPPNKGVQATRWAQTHNLCVVYIRDEIISVLTTKRSCMCCDLI